MKTKNILVTGASGNLGSAVVTFFLNKNHKVVGLVHQKSTDPNTHPNYKEVEVDLLEEKKVKNTVAELYADYGHFDAAILTAGGFKAGKLDKTGVEELEHLFKLNFITSYTLTRYLLTLNKENKPIQLFFIGSEQGMEPAKGNSVVAYALSKSLLFRLSEMINANRNYKDSISFVVVPSTIDTPQNREAVPDADFDKWQKPKDIAQIIHKHFSKKEKGKSVLVLEEELKGLS